MNPLGELLNIVISPPKGWQAYAACRGMDPEMFFLDVSKDMRKTAKATCAGCPVRLACLETQMELEIGRTVATRERMLYGGLSHTKRFNLEQQRRQAQIRQMQEA